MRRYLTVYLIALPLLAQDRAAINSTVTEPSGALVAGVSVELKSAETGLRRASVTDQGGRYQITTLPVGDYSLTLSKAGFRLTTMNRIALQYAETRNIDARLEVGGTTETIEVSAAAAEAVNPTNAEVGAVIEPRQIKEIPSAAKPGEPQLGRTITSADRQSCHTADSGPVANRSDAFSLGRLTDRCKTVS
jgi:hypothetical protein